MISRVFTRKFWYLHITSVSGHSVHSKFLREHSYMTSDVFWAFLTYLPTQKSDVVYECFLMIKWGQSNSNLRSLDSNLVFDYLIIHLHSMNWILVLTYYRWSHLGDAPFWVWTSNPCLRHIQERSSLVHNQFGREQPKLDQNPRLYLNRY